MWAEAAKPLTAAMSHDDNEMRAVPW